MPWLDCKHLGCGYGWGYGCGCGCGCKSSLLSNNQLLQTTSPQSPPFSLPVASSHPIKGKTRESRSQKKDIQVFEAVFVVQSSLVCQLTSSTVKCHRQCDHGQLSFVHSQPRFWCSLQVSKRSRGRGWGGALHGVRGQRSVDRLKEHISWLIASVVWFVLLNPCHRLWKRRMSLCVQFLSFSVTHLSLTGHSASHTRVTRHEIIHNPGHEQGDGERCIPNCQEKITPQRDRGFRRVTAAWSLIDQMMSDCSWQLLPFSVYFPLLSPASGACLHLAHSSVLFGLVFAVQIPPPSPPCVHPFPLSLCET